MPAEQGRTSMFPVPSSTRIVSIVADRLSCSIPQSYPQLVNDEYKVVDKIVAAPNIPFKSYVKRGYNANNHHQPCEESALLIDLPPRQEEPMKKG